MIPLCAREKISIEKDGIEWLYRPKVGTLEIEVSELLKNYDDLKIDQKMSIMADIVDMILIGWNDAAAKMPAFPENGKPSRLFGYAENSELLSYWIEANTLSEKEKKI